MPIITCLLIGVFGNVVYFYLESVHAFKFVSPKWWMLFSRFIMGVGAGKEKRKFKVKTFICKNNVFLFIACAAVIRTYVSSATNVEERTFALANISACQGLGFIV